jgi:Uma2 family endonuclease
MSLMPGSDASHPSAPTVKLTYDDFVRFPDDGRRHELIDGEHFVTPSPNRKHQAIVGNLHGLIWSYLRQNPIGRVFGSPFDVVFSNLDVVEPDLLYISNSGPVDRLTAKNVQGAPDLVVEVGSPGTRRRDITLKLELYERYGVQEYWVVDPDLDVVTVHLRSEGRLVHAHDLSLANGDSLTTPLLPSLTLPLSEVFADT